MCHSEQSRPPAPPGAVPAAGDRPLVLTSGDGTRVLAHEATPAAPTGVGVVVLPDVRGLHGYYRALAVRFAEAGAHAVAVDWFGRTADSDERPDGFDLYPHVERMTPQGVATDVAAAVAHLRGLGAERLFTVGFCLGGGYSWRQSADTPGLSGCAGFYGRSTLVGDAVDRLEAPLLMLMAGADAFVPASDGEELAQAAARRVPVELSVFAGAPHSFFDRSFAEHAADCARAWDELLAFTGLR